MTSGPVRWQSEEVDGVIRVSIIGGFDGALIMSIDLSPEEAIEVASGMREVAERILESGGGQTHD